MLNRRDQLQNEAAQKGVSSDDIKAANTKWRRAHALEGLEKGFKASVDSQDRINLSSALKRLKNFDDLDIAMGGEQNARKLISRLEGELTNQQSTRAKYTAAKVAGGSVVGYLGWKTFSGIVSAMMAK